MSWHWLTATGHVLYHIWPWAATAAAALFYYCADSQFDENAVLEDRLRTANTLLEQGPQRAFYQDQTNRAWRAVREWEERYEALEERCRVEHIARPLPTHAMRPEDVEKLIQEIPF